MVARYDKIHLFNLDLGKERFAEEGTLEAGKQVKVVDSPFGRIGLSVSYDIIRSHNGRIGYRRAPSGGAIFYFELPIVTPSQLDA